MTGTYTMEFGKCYELGFNFTYIFFPQDTVAKHLTDAIVILVSLELYLLLWPGGGHQAKLPCINSLLIS